MRKVWPEAGTIRTRCAFLFFPKTIHTKQGVWETRWLCYAKWTEQAHYYVYDGLCWEALHWID